MPLRYHAFAENAEGQLKQILITREGESDKTRPVSQLWTELVYKSEKETWADMGPPDCGAASEGR